MIANEIEGFVCHQSDLVPSLLQAMPRNLFLIHRVFRKETGKYQTIYECKYKNCLRLFRVKYNFKDHLKAHLRIKPFTCPECGKPFTQLSNMKTHLKGIHGAVLE